MNRTQKSIRNIIFALMAQIITSALAFVTRSVMIHTIGLEAISLNGLFTEIISALSLAELGIGSAIVYNLYKPLAENDYKKICQLMTLFKNVYNIIMVVTFILGTAICPFIQYFINDIGIPLAYIRLIYMLFIIQISLSYLFAYKTSLLNADQNRHIYSIIATIVKICGTVAMIIVLLVTQNYVLYLVFNIGITVLTNVMVSIKVDKIYPYIIDDNSLPDIERRQIFSNVKNIFIKQLSGKITNSTDNILISVLVSTIYVGYYSFYSIIIGIFKQLIDQVEGGIYASIGNLYAVEKNERCLEVLFRLTWMYGAFSIIVCTCVYCCTEPFICIWVGSQYLLPRNILAILCLNLFLYITSKPIYAAMHVSGFFVEGRNISIIGSCVNLIVSIILGKRIGMLGIFIGTFMTFLIQIVLKIKDVYRLRFKTSSQRYIALWLLLVMVFGTTMIISERICMQIKISNLFFSFLINGIIASICSMVLIIAFSFRRDELTYACQLMLNFRNKMRK